MTVRVYRYDDVGAPVLSSSVASSLIALLDACLVNGYGAKASAGWTKELSGTNIAAYRQGAGSRFYLRIINEAGVTKARAVGYHSMASLWDGQYDFPSTSQLSNGVYVTLAKAATLNGDKPWVLVADEKRFYLWVGFAFASASALSDSSVGQGIFFFGDLTSFKANDPYCCQIIGSPATYDDVESFSEIAALSSVKNGHYIAGSSSGVPGSIQNGKIADYYGCGSVTVIGRSTAIAYPDPVSGGINLSRVMASNGTAVKAVRGSFPGLWAPMNALPGVNGDIFTGSGELSGREFILLDCASSSGTKGRVAIEISDTWD